MRLNDPRVTSFYFENIEYPIDLSFDNVLDVFDVLNDSSLNEFEKAQISLALLLDCDVDASSVISLWNFIYESFIYIEQEQQIKVDLQGNPLPVQNEHKNLMDLEKDADHIYASFRQAYGMNLFDLQGKLHWHEFKSLLHGLPDNTIMKRIISIRNWTPSKGDSSEHKKAMEELQKVYSLDQPEDEEVE